MAKVTDRITSYNVCYTKLLRLAHLWDNGKTPGEELDRLMKVRAKAISNFSKDNIRANEPYSVLEDVFVPLYFLHRYQTEAATKVV